jgi:hypothetical protein
MTGRRLGHLLTYSEFTIFNNDRKLAALQTAAKMPAKLNEKKSLIFFSGGLNLNGIDNQAQVRATIKDAVRAGVSSGLACPDELREKVVANHIPVFS